MAKAPSAETQLRTLKRELTAYRESNARISRESAEYLRRATKAEQEAAEWKQRFDLLLSKCRDASITDGEPLPVTAEWLLAISHELDAKQVFAVRDRLAIYADAINQHRGAWPVQQVTTEMMQKACLVPLSAKACSSIANNLNAELAKSAAVQPVTPMKVAAYATLKDHLHTFEDVEDMKAFTRANNFSQAGYIDGHEHHPRKA